MQQYILRRILISIPVVLGVTLLAFAFVNLAPGDPISAFVDPVARAELGEEWVKERERQLGLDRPIAIRYFVWLGELLKGNLGYSLVSGAPVGTQILRRLEPTFLLMGSALLIAVVFGIPLGIASAIKQYSLVDYVATVLGFVAISTPSFFLGLAMIYIFAVKLHWLPTSGMRTLGAETSLHDLLKHMIMPVTVLGLAQIPLIMRFTRSTVLEVLRQDYVTAARAKGLAEQVLLVRHVLRNALIPLITIIGLSLPNLLSGAVIIETIFQWPGMGLLAIRAVNSRDYPLILGAILITGTVVLLSNLIADILYAVADPRIRY